MECCFYLGGGLACAMTGVLWDMRTQAEYSLVMLAVVLFLYKIMMMRFTTGRDGKPSSSRRVTAEQTMTVDV
jgi:membrane protein implicated in regulation of membrane protease activity